MGAFLLFGGGEGNRTPVRKPIRSAFYERIRLIEFPQLTANRRAENSGSFINT